MDIIIEVFNSDIAQGIRSLGYFSAFVGLWIIVLISYERRGKFKYFLIGLAAHHTLTLYWSSAVTWGLPINPSLFNVIISFTMGLTLWGFIYAIWVYPERVAPRRLPTYPIKE